MPSSDPIYHVRALVSDTKMPGPGDLWKKWFVCSSDVYDRAEEILDQAGWRLGNFKANPIGLASHQHRLTSGAPAGVVSWPVLEIVRAKDGGKTNLEGGMAFGATDLSRQYELAYMGDPANGKLPTMKAVSVGFKSLKRETRQIDGKPVLVHTEMELIEISPVAVGCNPEALAVNGIDYPAGIPAELEDRLKAMHAAIYELRDLLVEQIDELKLFLPDTGMARSREASDLDGASAAGAAGKSKSDADDPGASGSSDVSKAAASLMGW